MEGLSLMQQVTSGLHKFSSNYLIRCWQVKRSYFLRHAADVTLVAQDWAVCSELLSFILLITGFFHFVYESTCLDLLILKPPQAPNYPSFLPIISSPNFFKDQYTRVVRRIKITVSNYLAFSMFQVLYK